MTHVFKYESLSSSQIRLVQVVDHEDDTTFTNISCFKIANAPAYIALSYRWGDVQRDQVVLANGESLLITSSLKAFLDEVANRQTGGLTTYWYWIDAISINQDDTFERNRQVRRMRDIYQDARAIVIWLGASDQDTGEAVEFLNDLADLKGDHIRVEKGSIPGKTCRLGNDDSFVEVLYSTLTFEVSNLLQSNYWNRSWIVQEASTPMPAGSQSDARGTFVWCGSATIPWKKLCEANRKLLEAAWSNNFPELAQLHGMANEDIATLSHIERQRGLRISEPLYPTLVRSRASTAKDPRDKLYSVLGLVESSSEQLQPDYAQSFEQVYIKLAKYLITSSMSLDCLGSAGPQIEQSLPSWVPEHWGSALPNIQNLPSWVPDWSTKYSPFPQPFYQTDRTHYNDDSIKQEENLYNAGSGVPTTISFAAEDHHLIARGFCFDSVSSVAPPRSWVGHGKDFREIWEDWLALAAPETSKYPVECSSFEALTKILRADVADVWGDWSAARGGRVESFAETSINAFGFADGIIDQMTCDRRLLKTAKGYLGLCAAAVKTGDQICILGGSQMPLALRAQGDHWLFIGQAYVHGIMDGEAATDPNSQKLVDFEIW